MIYKDNLNRRGNVRTEVEVRIIAGSKRGTVLHTLGGDETRPTLDHVKEAVFSMLGTSVRQMAVLDLYAGSGAIGLECLSRGAESVVFVESLLEAQGVIEKNRLKLQFESSSLLLRMQDKQALQYLRQQTKSFDLIYMDPPFGKTDILKTLNQLVEWHVLKKAGLVVLEEPYESRLALVLSDYEVVKDKRYGRISIRMLRRIE